MLRAGPFSDPRLHAVINQRFVPFYLDLSPRGFVPDARGREFVLGIKPVLGGNRVPTPPVLVCTPDGELLAEVSNYADADTMLTTLREVAAAHAGTREPSAAEGDDPGLHATVLDLLGEHERAAAILTDLPDDDATALLRARLARWRGDLDRARSELDELDDDPAVLLERAWIAWQARDYAAIDGLLAAIPAAERSGEVRYLAGLASHAQGNTAAAQAQWRAMIEALPEGPWVYRADWAWVATEGGRSLLGRHGYMGSTQPDLAHCAP